jgi:hypothetical protein
MSRDEIEFWVTERRKLLAAKDTLSSIERTLNDPVVQKAQRIAQEAMLRKERRERLLRYALGAGFCAFVFWLVFV